MDYYDGNTVTALWNYAQHFAMSDNSFSDTFGPSTPGALNLVAGQTHGATPPAIPGGNVSNGTVIGDPRPFLDECWKTNPATRPATTVEMSGRNVGDLLNDHNVSWAWFQVGGAVCPDNGPHQEPVQDSTQTANPNHMPAAAVDEIGHGTGPGTANHQY